MSVKNKLHNKRIRKAEREARKSRVPTLNVAKSHWKQITDKFGRIKFINIISRNIPTAKDWEEEIKKNK